MRTRLIRLALVVAAFAGLAPAPPARACNGPVCDTICDVANSKVGQKVFKDGCPLL